MLCSFSLVLVALLSLHATAFAPPSPQRTSSKSKVVRLYVNLQKTNSDDDEHYSNRRRTVMLTTSSIVAMATTPILVALLPDPSLAGIDPRSLQNFSVEGDTMGTATRLRQVEAIQKPATDLQNIPFTELSSGVSYREYREGKGEATVMNGSKVAVEMTIRCKSFATNDEPGGLKYFTTKQDTDFDEVAFTVGIGEILPGLEEGMMGMKRNALRRIEVPSTMVFAAKKANQLPLPRTKDGKRRFENLFKTDATLLFEVLVTRVK